MKFSGEINLSFYKAGRLPLATDPTNPDTDGDGLLDGEEIDQTISWKRVINDTGDGSHGTYCIYFNMLSDPTKVDTDGDGYNDSDDIFPVQYDKLNGLIFQSEHEMGIGYDEGCLADDLQCGMYSYSDIFDICWLFKYQLESDEDENIDIFRSDAKLLFAFGNNNDDLIEDLIDKFIYGTGETIEIVTNDGVVDVPVYRSELLQIRYGNDEQVQNYLLSTVDIVKELLVENNGDINAIRDEAELDIDGSEKWDIEFGRDEKKYLFGGMTISVNDLWGSNVSIKDYSCDGNSFSGILHFNLYDHFGLDRPDVDIEKKYVFIPLFRAWFVLQHYEEYNGKYKPFINLVEFDIPFEGVL